MSAPYLPYEEPTAAHTVEDMRARSTKSRRAPKPRRHKKGRAVAMILCVLLIVASFLFLVADFFLPKGVAGYVTDVFSTPPRQVYALSCGTYATLGEARTAAEGVRAQAAAGFIAFDGAYQVLVAAYPTYDEAKRVADKSGYSLYPILAESLDPSLFPLSLRAKIKPTLDYPLELFNQLYELSAMVAEGATQSYAKNRVLALRDSLSALTEDFLSASADTTHSLALSYRATLLGVLAALQNLADTTLTDPLFLADLRWTAIMVLRVNRL